MSDANGSGKQPSAKARGSGTVQSVERALSILSAVAFSEEPLGVREIARRTELKPPTAHAIIKTLKRMRYLEDGGSGGHACRLGISSMLLSIGRGQELIGRFRKLAMPVIDKLGDEFHETVLFAALLGDSGYSVASLVPNRSLAVVVQSSYFIDNPHRMAVGKVLLSMADLHTRTSYCRREFRSSTCDAAVSLKAELASISISGFGEADNIDGLGVYGVAVPVFGVPGVPLAIAVSMPLCRCNAELKAKMKRLLKKYSGELQKALESGVS